MNLIFAVLDNLYRPKVLTKVLLGNFIHRTIKQCLKVAGIGLDHINAYMTEVINDNTHKVVYR